MSIIQAAITAVNGYVSVYVLINQELETMIDTNDVRFVTRTGIKERRIIQGEGKATSALAVPAVNGLLEKRGISADEIELIIFCTSTPDMMFPATGNILADKIGAKKAWGYDLQAACSGFLFGLTTAAQFIESGKHKKVLVVGADKMSSVVNYQDRSEEHTSELQSREKLVCRLLLEKKKKNYKQMHYRANTIHRTSLILTLAQSTSHTRNI